VRGRRAPDPELPSAESRRLHCANWAKHAHTRRRTANQVKGELLRHRTAVLRRSALARPAERQPAVSGVRLTKQGARRWKVLRRGPGTHDPAAPKTSSWRPEHLPEPQCLREPKGRSGLTRWSSSQFPKNVGSRPPLGGPAAGALGSCRAMPTAAANSFGS